MTVPTTLILIAAVLAVVELFEERGRSWLGWGVLCIAAALVWGPRI